MAIPEEVEILYLRRIARRDHTPIKIRTGTKLPAYCTSTGKAILAFSPLELVAAVFQKMVLKPLTGKTITDKAQFENALATVRAKRFAWSDEELSVSNLPMAALILDQHGYALAAVNAGAPTINCTLAQFI